MNQNSPSSFLNKVADYDNFYDIGIFSSPNINMEDDCDEPHQFGLSSTTKRIQKLQNTKRKNQNTSNEARLELIEAVKNGGEKIKHVAHRLGIKYSSAKAICQVYEKEGRVKKIMLKRKAVKEQLTPLTSILEADQETNSRPSEKEPLNVHVSSQIFQSQNIDQNETHPKIINQPMLQNASNQRSQYYDVQQDNFLPNKGQVYYVTSGTLTRHSNPQIMSTSQIPNCFLEPTQFFQIQRIYPVQITNDSQYKVFLTNNSSNTSNDSKNLTFQPQQFLHRNDSPLLEFHQANPNNQMTNQKKKF